ncbi:MAG: UPF0301 protein [Candidatus Binatia bacterium]|nr:MAG: UPF0301 protein [Candidatus Binatia bacterium]
MNEKSLAPSLLLAMPQMTDPNFARSVVLLCEHGKEGTMGLVVNRPTTTPLSSVVQWESLAARASDVRVWIGGPVEPHRGWILSRFDPGTRDRIEIGESLYLSGSVEALRRFLSAPPELRRQGRFLLGYAGWAPGQLEGELAASAWLNAPLELDLVFETPPERMWDAAVRSLGIDPASLQMGPGVH